MAKKRCTEEQIIGILREGEAGAMVADICRRHAIHEQSYYLWKSRYGGMEVSEAKRLRELEEENRRLKRMGAELTLEKTALEDVVESVLPRHSNETRRSG